MAFTENLADFFDQGDFAEAATLDGASVSGIFDYQSIDALGVATRTPSFELMASLTTSTTPASLLVVRGLIFRVRSIDPDGTGVVTLRLELQP